MSLHAAAPGCIAIVDDDPAIAEALSGWLGLLDIPCCVHCSAESLLAQLLDAVDTPLLEGPQGAASTLALRAAMLDINLPGLSGFDLAHRLRQSYPRLTIVLITARCGPELERLGPMPPGVACLQKPFDLCALQALLLGAADGAPVEAHAGP